MSLLPPGRFLMPGNLAGSPALKFAPLDLPDNGAAPEGSLWAMMRRRYEAYKDVGVRPFFSRSFLQARPSGGSCRCPLGFLLRAGSPCRAPGGARGDFGLSFEYAADRASR